MTNLSRREKILLIIAILVVGAAAYNYLLYQPLTEERTALESEIADLESSIVTAQERIEQIPDLEQQLEELREERETILEMGYHDSEEVLARLNLFSRRSGVRLNSYELDETEEGYPFYLSGEGDYTSMLEFIWLIDDWDYRLEIEDFALAANREENNLEADFDFFFHQHEDIREFLE